MNVRTILVCTIVVFVVFADTEARKTSGGRRSSGWGTATRSRSTPRPRTSQSSHTGYQANQGGSHPDKIGWNVADKNKQPGTNTGAKPSAPVNENIGKTSATNVQSSYNPSGGYPRQPASNPYNPAPNSNVHGGYNPSQSYNPAVGGHSPYGPGYNAPGPYNPGHAYSPSGGQHYNPSFGQPSYGQPSFGQPSYGQPSFGHASPYSPNIGQAPQTILLQSQSSRPGIGQLAKEAFVFAGVSAGVNAAVNRILPGGIYGTRGSGSGNGGGTTHTEITYNNYYNNGTAPSPNGEQAAPSGVVPLNAANPAPNPAANPPPAAAEPNQASQTNAGTNSAPPNAGDRPNSNSQENNPNPLGYVTSNDDIKKLTESLFEKDKNNAYQHITMNLQGQKKDDSKTDDAPEPLLTVKPEAYEIPTVKSVLALHDNYELDVKTKETISSDERREESELLDKFLETEVMQATMKFLADKGYIPNDEYEFKDTLRRIWFSLFKRTEGDASSSGFETVFLAEQFDSDVIGLHNWIYYAKKEAENKLNYLGYIKEVKLGNKGAVVKVRSTLNDVLQPVTAIFVGTSPELELALYTMCFFMRPNNVCPISLGGTEFMIVANRVNYFGKDILIAAYPDI